VNRIRSDHTREHIPVLAFGPGIGAGNIGIRDTFADIGQSIAAHLKIQPLANGVSFL
jgi:phosphopentomutase